MGPCSGSWPHSSSSPASAGWGDAFTPHRRTRSRHLSSRFPTTCLPWSRSKTASICTASRPARWPNSSTPSSTTPASKGGGKCASSTARGSAPCAARSATDWHDTLGFSPSRTHHRRAAGAPRWWNSPLPLLRRPRVPTRVGRVRWHDAASRRRRPEGTGVGRAVSLARTVAWNSGVQVGGRLVGLLASLFFNALLIRHLGIATFGQFTAASVYVGLFMILGESGLYLVSVRRAMQEPELRGRILGTALGLRLLWTCIPLGLAFAIAQCIPVQRFPTYQPVVKLVIGIVAFNEYIRLLSQFLTAVFRMHLRMDLAVIGEVGSRLVALAGILLVVHSGGGLVSVALAFLAANAVNLAYAWVMAQRLERFRPQLHRPVVGSLLRESVVVAGVLVLSLLRLQVGTFLLSLLRPAEDVGVYGVAIKVHEVLVTFPGLFIALLYPVLSRLASEDATKLRHTFQRTFDVMVLAGVVVALEIVLLAPHITAVLGETRATLPLRILALSLPSVFVGMSFSHLLLAEGRQGI